MGSARGAANMQPCKNCGQSSVRGRAAALMGHRARVDLGVLLLRGPVGVKSWQQDGEDVGK